MGAGLGMANFVLLSSRVGDQALVNSQAGMDGCRIFPTGIWVQASQSDSHKIAVVDSDQAGVLGPLNESQKLNVRQLNHEMK